MRRLLGMLLAISLLLSMAVGIQAAETEVDTQAGLVLEVTQSKTSATVQVYLQGGAGVTNGRICVGYDAAVLKLAQTDTTAAYAVSSVNDTAEGKVYLAWVGSDLTNDKILLLTLTLEADSQISKDLTYTAVSEGVYAGEDAVQAEAASVTVAYTPAVDTSVLEKAIADAQALVEQEYTAGSYAAVMEALNEALLVLADNDATQSQVDAAASKLTDAIAALVGAQEPGKVDKSKLEETVKKASALKKDDYTADSYAAMQQALERAKTVLEKEDATQAQVDAAEQALQKAIDALKSPQTGDDTDFVLLIALLAVSAVGIVVIVILLRKGKGKQVARCIAIVLSAAMVLPMLPAGVFAADGGLTGVIQDAMGKAVGKVQQIAGTGANLFRDQGLSTQLVAYEDDDMVRVIVELQGKSLLERGYTKNQIAAYGVAVSGDVQKLEKLQNHVTEQIAGIVEKSGLAEDAETEAKYNFTVALNGIAVTVPYGTLEKIRKLDGVEGAYVVSQYETAKTEEVSSPSMYSTSTSFGSAQTWQDLGYTGEGMKIAVVDTGLDVDHPSFADAPKNPSMTLADVEHVLTELNAYKLYSQKSAVPLTAEKLYYNEKVPYGFNYVDRNVDVTHDYDSMGDHGTHVAGIAAANKLDSTDVVGVAPDAQLVIMKVFGYDGGAYTDDLLAAIEDCILLGVDVINMSLGAPAGYTEDSELVNEVYGRVLKTDMVLAIAAGNTNSAATGNALGTNLNYTSDPDNGLVNSPSTYLGATSVASLENDYVMMPYITVGEDKIIYVDVSYTFTSLAGAPMEYVMIPGLGEEADYEGLDVSGKIAVVERGTIDFATKQINAAKAGAAALIVYDNVDGDMISMYDEGVIMNVFVTKESGEILKKNAGEDGSGTLEVMPYGVEIPMKSIIAGELSSFSCWGVTPDLQLAPDVTAPGGNIYSCYMDGKYGTMSGTSMACPHIAGMSALVLQHLHETYPDLPAEQYHIIAEALVMCTAVPVVDPDGILYSPRKQGAGSANVYSAISSPVYLTSLQAATGELTPKASMGDDPDRTGVFTFSFDLNNLDNQAHTFLLDGMALTEQFLEIDGKEYMAETGRDLSAKVSFEAIDTALQTVYDANGDGRTDMDDVQLLLDVVNGLKQMSDADQVLFDLSGDGVLNTVDAQLLYELVLDGIGNVKKITVPAQASVTVNVTVALSEEDMAYMDAHFENGIYVDGFVRAYAQDAGAVDLSLPFMGFYGGWHEAPMFDTGWYYEEDEDLEYNRYLNVIFADMGADGTSAGGLGLNPYIDEKYDPAHNVLSPNGDYYYDYVNEIYVSMMRNAEILDFTWTDDATGEELFYEYYPYARKSYYWAAYGMCMPVVYTDGGLEPFTFYDENGKLMVEDLQKLTLTIRAYLDDGELDNVDVDENGDPIPNTAWADEVIEIPVVIDLQSPKMDISSIVYTVEDGRTYITFQVEDNYDIAAVVAMTNGGDVYEVIPVTEKLENVDGEKATIKLDITDYDAAFQLSVIDYGFNEVFYQLTNEAASMSGDRFYAFRRYSSPILGSTMYATDQLNGWYSFENADDMLMHTSQSASGEATVFAAEYIDGYIIGAQGGQNVTADANTLFVMKEGSWDRIPLGSGRELNRTVYEWPNTDLTYLPLKMVALDMAYDYTSDTLYMLANALSNNYIPEGMENILLKIDYLTGDVTVLGVIESADGEAFTALTLACDNDGVLYTINYQNGKLYTVNKEPASTTEKYGYGVYRANCVSIDDPSYYAASYTQSMTVDHATNKLYWAAYQSKVGVAYFMEVDKTTGGFLSLTPIEDNSEMVGLFKPYDSGKDIIPTAELEGITLNHSQLYLKAGQNATLTALAEPYYAALSEVQWSTSDPSVATVSPYGIVEAHGIGAVTVTASCGGFTAECTVNVSSVDGTLFAYSGDYWLLMDAGRPDQAVQVVDAMELEGEVRAAAYHNGFIYAAAVEESYDADYNSVYTTNLYKLDANTLSGTLIGTAEGEITALAFNYADGYLYGMTHALDMDLWADTYSLVRVNPRTAAMDKVTDLNGIFNPENYDMASGALAIDYEGNFYVNGCVCIDPDTYVTSNVLVQFTLDGQGSIDAVSVFEGLADSEYSVDAMVWSERNGGILRAYQNPDTYEYELSWLDVSDMNKVVSVSLGTVRGGGAPGVLALAIPVTSEPELPYVQPTQVTLEESYTVPAGETITAKPGLEPWNATGSFLFRVEDETVATVDEDGVITGIAEGQTTLVVTEVATGLTAAAPLTVVKNPGYLYGFFQADIAQGIPLEYWVKLPLSNTADSKIMTEEYPFTVYSADYFDGYVYACAQDEMGLYYILKINASNFTYEVLNTCKVLIRDLAFDYTTGAMYAVASDGNVAGGLYQMDLKTGELTFVADNDMGVALVTLAADDKGVLYATDDYGEVFIVNKHTAELSSTGIYGGYSRYLQSMTYDYNNDAIYWACGGTIYQVDVDNGKLITVGKADVDSGESATVGCIVSGLFSVPQFVVEIPEAVEPSGIALGEKNTVAVGETLALPSVVLPLSVSKVDQTIRWSSGDETVAVVDENGVVTGVSAGEVYITATDASGNTASILITVTAEHRYFYGYDELSSSWVQFDLDGKIVNTWTDAEGMSPIVAAQYIGDVLYAYDADGYFYSIDTETFQRTKLGDGIHGMVTDLEANDRANGYYFVEDVPYQVIDMTYAQSRRGYVAYAVLLAYNVSEWLDDFSYKVVQIDLTTGEVAEVIVEDQLVDYEMSLRPTNLLWYNDYLYTVNGYITGMITKIDPVFGDVTGAAIFPEYWGDFNGGRSFVEDPLTGVIYAVRDKRTDYIGMENYDDTKAQSELCVIGLGIGYCEKVCNIGAGMRITGMFIK